MADSIFDAAVDLLGRVEDAAANAGVVLPERRFVSNGEVAFDCELVAIQVPTGFRGSPALPSPDRNRRNVTVWTFEFTVWLIRCVPTINDRGIVPTAAALQDSASVILRDAHILTYDLMPLLDDLSDTCTHVAAGNLVGVGPEGGFAGWQLPIQIGL